MIVQERDGRLMFFKQTDHALLSGSFAAAWGNETVPGFEPRASTLVAAARHDDGWSQWELAPTVDADGRPVDFIHIPVGEHVDLYRRGIDLTEAEDHYAGLVVSMHGERLYTRPFYPGMKPRIENLMGADLERARDYVAHEQLRQDRLRDSVGETTCCAAEEAWRLLQVWDRLSLLVCMQPLESASGTMPPIALHGEDVKIEVHGDSSGRLVLDPYPFGEQPARFAIEARVLGARTWPTSADLRRDYRLAQTESIEFDCTAG